MRIKPEDMVVIILFLSSKWTNVILGTGFSILSSVASALLPAANEEQYRDTGKQNQRK